MLEQEENSNGLPHRVIEKAVSDLEGIEGALVLISMAPDLEDKDAKAINYLANGIEQVGNSLDSVWKTVLQYDQASKDLALIERQTESNEVA